MRDKTKSRAFREKQSRSPSGGLLPRRLFVGLHRHRIHPHSVCDGSTQLQDLIITVLLLVASI
jgi:hypothetical protein